MVLVNAEPVDIDRVEAAVTDAWYGSSAPPEIIREARMTSAAPKRILVVDDDPAICKAYSELLSASGYVVMTAGSRAAALAEVARAKGEIDAMILDIGLPDADGADVARDIAAQIGNRPILYVSGWAEDFWQLSDAPGRWRVRQKPIPIPWLLQAVRWLADGGDPPAD